METLASIFPVMEKCGATCPPHEFHSIVNLAFHRAESGVYDIVHREMWESLPRQYQVLVDDYTQRCGLLRRKLSMLDIGCGTGLSAELLLGTRLGALVSEVDLLDTSPEMLERARKRAETWPVAVRTIEGTSDLLIQRKRRYDLIVICSVLHHIPNLAAFLEDVQTLQAAGGIVIHLQDPNGDYLQDPALRQRMAELQRSTRVARALSRLHPTRVFRRLRSELTGIRGDSSDYIGKVNCELIQAGIIRRRMSASDIWIVTDLHVHDGAGISIGQMRRILNRNELVSSRSYAFFGEMPSTLPARFRERERELADQRAPNGFHVSAIWKRRSGQ